MYEAAVSKSDCFSWSKAIGYRSSGSRNTFVVGLDADDVVTDADAEPKLDDGSM